MAAKLSDPEAALKQLLGPEINALGDGQGPLSAQIKAVIEHKYAPDRYGQVWGGAGNAVELDGWLWMLILRMVAPSHQENCNLLQGHSI